MTRRHPDGAAQVVFDHLVIPVGSFLLQHTERAVQVTRCNQS